MTRPVAIVGGGLAGLHAAWLLDRCGADYVLLEARDRFGGRLLTVRPDSSGGAAGPAGAFDLGATWFWPSMQPGLARLVGELGLETFLQPGDGDLVVEGTVPGHPFRTPGYASAPPSVRLAGGMGSLVQALRSRIRPERARPGHRVSSLTVRGDGVELEAVAADGARVRHEVDRVLLAMPPRLAQATLRFEAPLPDAVAADWAASPTWMAPHAKYLAVYGTPFWRALGLSGGARSRSGPMVEIHDASSPGGPAALFGFVGVPAGHRRRVPEASLRATCRAQLARLFGDEAADPVQDWLQDWSQDPFTATAADLLAEGHPSRAALQVREGPWHGRLVGIASEWSRDFPGYVAGAVQAATAAVERGVPA